MNLSEMSDAIALVKTGQVTYAIKDTTFEGMEIREGDYMGILEKDIIVSLSLIHIYVCGQPHFINEASQVWKKAVHPVRDCPDSGTGTRTWHPAKRKPQLVRCRLLSDSAIRIDVYKRQDVFDAMRKEHPCMYSE